MIEGLLRLFGYEPRAYATAGVHPSAPIVADYFNYGRETDAGLCVTEFTALNFSAVFRAVSLVSSSVAGLPLHVYEKVSGDERRQAEEHPLDYLLNDEPNPEMDAATFRETLQAHVLTWGNGYAYKEYANSGELLYLWPISPDRVAVKRKPGGELVYEIRQDSGTFKELPASKVFHLAGLGYDGLIGYSPIALGRQCIGLGLAAETFGARFFGKGTHLGGIITRPPATPWKDDAARRFRDDFRSWHEGLSKSHKIAVLEDGMSWVKLGVPPNEAQFLETRKFQVTEIARWYGVPPHMLYDLERSTNNNIEHQGLEFLNFCLRPWLRKWELAVKRSLLSEPDRKRYYVEHVTEQIVKADLAARYAAYNTGRQGGWLSINDIRKRENLSAIPGGDTYLEPLNMVQAGNGGAKFDESSLDNAA